MFNVQFSKSLISKRGEEGWVGDGWEWWVKVTGFGVGSMSDRCGVGCVAKGGWGRGGRGDGSLSGAKRRAYRYINLYQYRR